MRIVQITVIVYSYLLSSNIIHDELTRALPPQDPSVGDAVHTVFARADVCT